MFKAGIPILVASNNGSLRQMVVGALKQIGFKKFIQARDGLEAFVEMEKSAPPVELIISDWNMPNASGLDLLKKIRADKRFVKAPFLLLTGEASKEQILEAAKAGVSNYLVAPFTAQSLAEKLEAVHKKIKAASVNK